MFKALRVHKTGDDYQSRIENMHLDDLPEGEVLIQVHYSSVNYKDALSSIGSPGVTKNYPHSPGIDASGIVVESTSPLFKKGDQVLVTGYDLGMNTHGGFSQMIRVPADWVLALPEKMSLRDAMVLGTAGLTAALSVNEVLPYLKEASQVLVTGPSGGVGSTAIKILKKLGYKVQVPLRRKESQAFLEELGVDGFVDYEDINKMTSRPLASAVFDGAVDTAGGAGLHYALASTAYGGAVSACGNAASVKLETTVFPFILRGVRLVGIDSVLAPQELRKELWEKLAGDWKSSDFEKGIQEISLDQVPQALEKVLAGKHQGRYLIKVK